MKRNLAELGEVQTSKELERIIGIIFYTRCAKDVEMIWGPLREGFRTFKLGQVSEDRIKALNVQVKEVLERAIANVHWLVLPGIKSDSFAFIVESDWSSRHSGCMIFTSKNEKERLIDMGSKMQKFASSSYLGEFNALVWACKRTKASGGDSTYSSSQL